MTGKQRIGPHLGALGLALALAGCSSGSAGLTTGTTLLGGSGNSTPQAAAAPETPIDRALHVGATTARARRCGYVFDPAGVRSAYLAYEASQGGAADQLARTEKSYDHTVASIAKTIAGEEDYCSDDQTAIIKKDLGRVLAGDFSAPRGKPAATGSWWGGGTSAKPFDREEALKTKDSL